MRSTFASRFGTIAVVGGSVVGLGNIWRFPYILGENGGAAFILVYIAVSLLISIPIMLSEFAIGRSSRKNALRSFSVHSKNPLWQGVGMLGIVSAFLILSFYSVVAGWAVEYFFAATSGGFIGKTPPEISEGFTTFVASGWMPIFFALSFITASGAIVAMGVQKGIERFNKILMPMMVFIFIGLAINAATMDGFGEGLSFLFKPDFSKLTWDVVMQAVGQSFFSMSLGLGSMITYGSYLRKGDNMFRIAGSVAIADLAIALLACVVIFPAVFSYGIDLTSGPDLVFLTLPNIFAQMPGGYFIGVAFFFLLFVAAITSSVSLYEVIVAYLSEEFNVSRLGAVTITGIATGGLASLCALSQMPDSELFVGGENIFDLFNTLTANYTMPIGAILIVIFAGWVVTKRTFIKELTSSGKFGRKLLPFLLFMIKFIVPVAIAMMFIANLR